MTTINPTIFRAYDIRGVVDRDLSVPVYERLGQAAGTYFRSLGGRRIVVARDARLTSPAFAAALIDGLRSTGCDVVDLGMVPTPVMYFALSYLRADGGAVVTASHNPPEFNGLKLRRSDPHFGGEPLDGAAIQEVGRIALSGEFASGSGSYEQHDIADAYVADIARHLRLERPVTIVLDGGNGVAGPIGMRTFQAIGCEVIPLYIEPDGRFPNHHPDPLKEENLADLKQAVVQHGAALGISLDGDGDRLGVVDGSGTMIFADRYMIVLARHLLQRGPAPIIYDVKCSSVLEQAVRAFGGTPVMWKTGYTNGSAKMRELGAPLAGELSGHIFGSVEHHYYDDGTFAGCLLLKALEQSGQTLQEALAPYPPLPSLSEGRIHYDEALKFKAIDYIYATFSPHYPVSTIDGVRVDFGDGWGLLRASNTEPAITSRFEATTWERATQIRDQMLAALHEFERSERASTDV
ncbi:MAG TPA: phosphomannomutase/phosphoglucomutase [Roseiflexaceae bacterium]|nr:phosphomannomutase/phosphoglucomutase [Roseiflexaceae bacterium]